MAAGSCPTCAGNLDDPRPISVCSACHTRLLARGDIPLAATGEFAALTPELAGDLLTTGTAPSVAAPVANEARCTWCGKGHSEVQKLLSSGAAHICNECVGLCADIMYAELGDNWRS